MESLVKGKIDEIMNRSARAFDQYKRVSLKERSALMHAIADELEAGKTNIVRAAVEETYLSEKRLQSELVRTAFQMRSYGDYCASGQWMDIRIDHADPGRVPPKPDLRKMMIPLGPVVVFGAANFPLAYSTAGGDTASALAAGCSVVVKAHPGHVQTGSQVAEAIHAAVKKCGMPEDIFIHVTDSSIEAGEALVKHPLTKAVGFTGSLKGGKQIFDWGNQREIPIPVFAEMSSVNPVFIFPVKLSSAIKETAAMLAASITQDAGQFCTNPGIIIGIDNPDLEVFIAELKLSLQKTNGVRMLNEGIEKNYLTSKEKALAQKNVSLLLDQPAEAHTETVSIAATDAATFIETDILQNEVFGPYSLIVKCKDLHEMNRVALSLRGQLTATIIATEDEVIQNKALAENIQSLCGRCIMNGVPTGVEVCLAMQHGGPYPASTDSRFTSVGADGIKRFARPLAFQNWPDELLPDELKESNPLGIWRTVGGVMSYEL